MPNDTLAAAAQPMPAPEEIRAGFERMHRVGDLLAVILPYLKASDENDACTLRGVVEIAINEFEEAIAPLDRLRAAIEAA